MVEKTPNHGLHKYSQGELDWTHSPDMQTIEERMIVRDEEANLGNYAPYRTATFRATDTGAVYDGTGDSWRPAGRGFGAVQANSINRNRVYDLSGRYHGELTGSNDAKVVVDALADRADDAGVVVPDPGFALEWERQVDIPATEMGFTLATEGLPTLSVPNGFSGSHAIRKPETGSQVHGYRIGGFEIDDPNGVLNPAISLSDLKESVIEPSLFWNCPAIEILSDNSTFSNQNKILYPFIKGEFDGSRRAGIFFGGSDGTADQNWVYSPHYIETNFSDPNSVAYHDEGAFNSWILTRAESADTIHLFDGCREYYVSEGGWDRVQYHRRTIEERNGARGKIELREASRYEAVDVISPQTRIECRGRFRERTNPLGQPVDVLDDFARVTTARSLGSMGFRDNSSGGSVSIGPTMFDHPCLDWSTGSSSGNTAVLDLGPESLKTQALPKAAYSFGPESGGGGSDDDGVIARHGFWAGPNDRAELVYDPTNALGNHSSSNWYFEVVDGGNLQGRVDMGIGPDTFSGQRQTHSLSHVLTGQAGPGNVWVATVETGNKETIRGTPTASGTWRWYVESTDGRDKRWNMEPRDGHRLYRT